MRGKTSRRFWWYVVVFGRARLCSLSLAYIVFRVCAFSNNQFFVHWLCLSLILCVVLLVSHLNRMLAFFSSAGVQHSESNLIRVVVVHTHVVMDVKKYMQNYSYLSAVLPRFWYFIAVRYSFFRKKNIFSCQRTCSSENLFRSN